MNDLLRDQFIAYFSTMQIEEYRLSHEEGTAEIDITGRKSEAGQVAKADHQAG